MAKLEIKSTKFRILGSSGAESKSADSGEVSILGASFLNIDRGFEMIVPGAYSKHLEYFSKNGKVLVDHNNSVRSIAAKVYRAYETKAGLVIDSKFSGDDVGQWARAKAAEGAIDTTSIGHYVLNDPQFADETEVRRLWEQHEYTPTSYDMKLLTLNKGQKVRLITEAEPVEVSFVAVPMNPEARVLEVKSILSEIESKKGAMLNKVNRTAVLSIYKLARSIYKSAKLDGDESQEASGQSGPNQKAAGFNPAESKSRTDLLKLKLKLVELRSQLKSY